MPVSPKRSTKRQQRPARPNPWSEWMDAAVGIGHVVVAYELMLVAALSPVPALRRSSPGRAHLVLVHSCAAVAAPARPRGRSALQSVPRRDEGKA